GDYFGLGREQIAVFRPTTAEFFLRGDAGQATRIPYGVQADVPVPGDYTGTGRAQVAVFRPSTREWFLRADSGATTLVQWGGAGDVPVLLLKREPDVKRTGVLVNGVPYTIFEPGETLTATFTQPDG